MVIACLIVTIKNRRNMSFQNDVSNALLNMYDVRNKLSSAVIHTNNPEAINGLMKVFDTPKDNDGSSITIGDCIDDVIEMLENYDNGESSTW
jgi:hypothetical protein